MRDALKIHSYVHRPTVTTYPVLIVLFLNLALVLTHSTAANRSVIFAVNLTGGVEGNNLGHGVCNDDTDHCPPWLANSSTTPLNIIYIMTDDQRWDSLCGTPDELAKICEQPTANHPMPTVETKLMGSGVVFTNAFVSDPLCCPSRASFLSGGFYSHHTNVLSNLPPNGGVTKFIDTITIATVLQKHGYKTAFLGKYLNGYHELDTLYIPPGWDQFIAQGDLFGDWMNYQLVTGSSTFDKSGIGTELIVDDIYITDFLRDQALAFLDNTCQYKTCTSSFFLWLSLAAPHEPAPPAPRHETLFSDFLYKGRGFEEQPDGDLGDKPEYVQSLADHWTRDAENEYHRNALRSLRAVDEAVGAIIDNLIAKNLLKNTVIIFASDNGYMWGEHMLSRKSKAYEESIRVPLVMLVPSVGHRFVEELVTLDLDLAPTILELAGATPMGGDGMSLMPLLSDPNAPWRHELLIEHLVTGPYIPAWAAIRTDDNWKYVEYVTGEKELYNLQKDPYELNSKHNDSNYKDIMEDLEGRLMELSRGTAIKLDDLPNPQTRMLPGSSIGQLYSFQFSAWGGNGEYVWSTFVDEASDCTEALPDGLGLTAEGRLFGTPTASGTWKEICIKVEDISLLSPQPGNTNPQQQIGVFGIKIEEGWEIYIPLIRHSE